MYQYASCVYDAPFFSSHSILSQVILSASVATNPNEDVVQEKFNNNNWG